MLFDLQLHGCANQIKAKQSYIALTLLHSVESNPESQKVPFAKPSLQFPFQKTLSSKPTIALTRLMFGHMLMSRPSLLPPLATGKDLEAKQDQVVKPD